MSKRIKEILKNKNNWVAILTLIASFIAVAIDFFVDEDKYLGKVVSIVLLLMALEFFVLTVGVFEKMLKGLDEIKNQQNKGVWKREENLVGEVNKLLKSAENEFIVVGGTLSHLGASRDLINDISKNVKVRLLALNIEKEDILNEYNKLIERNGGVTNLMHLKSFVNNANIEIRTFESLPLAYFIASDLNYPNGSIKATHHFTVGSLLDYPCVELNHSNAEWYEIYHRQIESLWDKGTAWESEEV